MQIGAGASVGRPVSAESLAKGDPAASGALRYIRDARRAPQGRSEQPLPAEPLPPLPPPWRPQDNAQPLFRRGLGREAGLGPVPSGRSVPPSPRPPAPRRPHTGGFPLGRGRPRRFYITIGLCALGTRFPVVEGPAGPRLHPVPGPPVPRPGALANLMASISLITCWPRRAAETFPGTPSPPWEPEDPGRHSSSPLTRPGPLRGPQYRTRTRKGPLGSPTPCAH